MVDIESLLKTREIFKVFNRGRTSRCFRGRRPFQGLVELEDFLRSPSQDHQEAEDHLRPSRCIRPSQGLVKLEGLLETEILLNVFQRQKSSRSSRSRD